MNYKQYKLNPWCKRAQIAMIKKDLSVADLVNATGYSPQHLCSVLNGRIISDRAISKISDYLGISNEHG